LGDQGALVTFLNENDNMQMVYKGIAFGRKIQIKLIGSYQMIFEGAALYQPICNGDLNRANSLIVPRFFMHFFVV